MAGVNSLGLGSGVLTSDLIDKLRAADDASIITPITNKITLANQKDDAYTLLSSLMTTFKASTSTLGGENLYLGRSVSGNTDAVTVTAQSGSDIQTFNITNVKKAEKDIWNSQTTFASTSLAIPSLGTGTFTVKVGGTSLDIAYTPQTSLNDIKTAINEYAGSSMTASSLQVGDSAYSLTISADALNKPITFSDSNSASVAQLDTITLANNVVSGDTFKWSDGTHSITLDEATGGLVTGETPAQTGARIADAINQDSTLKNLYTATATSDGFTIEAKSAGTAFPGSSTSTGSQTSAELTTTPNVNSDSLLTALGFNNIQQARAATFNYNGIAVTRSTNNITDLINGVTISLNQNQASTDTATINITQNDSSMGTELSTFVANYNLITANLRDTTSSDTSKGTVGIFSGESFIKSISRTLTGMITQVNSDGNSLMNYGISIAKDGTMSLDSSVFNAKFSQDPTAMQLLFSGDSTIDGIFKKLDNQMADYTGYSGQMSNFSNQLATAKTSLTTQYDRQKANLDARYATLTKRFTAYDAMISRLNSQFSSLKMIIDAQSTSTSTGG